MRTDLAGKSGHGDSRAASVKDEQAVTTAEAMTWKLLQCSPAMGSAT